MPKQKTGSKVGVFIDCANIYRNGGSRMKYEILREFACRDGSEPIRLNAYVSYDAERAKTDLTYKKKAEGFHSALRDVGYKVIIKEVKTFVDEFGARVYKANSDLDLAVDALLQSESLDRVLIASGDGDFVQVVRALQNRGCRVEVVGLDNVSAALRQEADLFMSGFLIPHLIPVSPSVPDWGAIDSIVRGWCYFYDDSKGIGFMRYLAKIDNGLWITDKRQNVNSPYEAAFFHFSKFSDDSVARLLPSRDLIFQFKLAPSGRGQENLTAEDIELVSEL